MNLMLEAFPGNNRSMSFSRRHFLSTFAATTAGFAGLRRASLSQAFAQPQSPVGYGPVVPDPDGVLTLPRGFSYTLFSRSGDRMNDGFVVPRMHDGMGSFAGPDGTTLLVRNHECTRMDPDQGPFGPSNQYLTRIDPSRFYEPGLNNRPATGGTTTLVYDTREQKLITQHLSLTGTLRNCAGGVTPWGTWISCEETELRADGVELTKDHGFNFEVPATAEASIAEPTPLTAMGRFNHEAVAVDPATGIVYQTEDKHAGIFTRFIPYEPGNLAAGGRLQALCIIDPDGVDGAPGYDTRNWPKSLYDRAQTGNAGDLDPRDWQSLENAPQWPTGESKFVRWMDLPDRFDILAPENDLRYQVWEAGAARFARGEGMWHGRGAVYFACTNGGAQLRGQLFRYFPSPFEGTARETEQPGRLELFVEATGDNLIKNADNICVAPWGDLILCEDTDENHLLGVTPEGEVYLLGENVLNGAEFAGACFSPDGTTLFVNIQTPGFTLAITGPWLEGRRG